MKEIAQPKSTPLAMDEFLWLRKPAKVMEDRAKRVENQNKDKKDS